MRNDGHGSQSRIRTVESFSSVNHSLSLNKGAYPTYDISCPHYRLHFGSYFQPYIQAFKKVSKRTASSSLRPPPLCSHVNISYLLGSPLSQRISGHVLEGRVQSLTSPPLASLMFCGGSIDGMYSRTPYPTPTIAIMVPGTTRMADV